MVILLESGKEVTNCLMNCSNNGICKLDQQYEFICECFKHYSGSDCTRNQRHCSRLQCLNYGTCIDKISQGSYDFECKCQHPFSGKRCGLRANLCANRTCSKQGACKMNNTMTYCHCYSGHSGNDCEILSQKTVLKKAVSNTAAVIAILMISSFAAFVVISDVFGYCLKFKNP